MRQKILFIFIVFAVVVVRSALAASESAELRATSEAVVVAPATESASIKDIRDKIASRVAQLRKKDAQVVSGEVREVTDTTLVIESLFGKRETISLDETLTKYYKYTGSAREEIERKKIITGTYILVLGHRADANIEAEMVLIDEMFQVRAGRVVEVEGTSTIKIDTFEKEKMNIQVDRNVTYQSLNQKDHSLAQGALSKIKEGDTVRVVFRIRAISQTFEKVQAVRVLHIPAAYFQK